MDSSAVKIAPQSPVENASSQVSSLLVVKDIRKSFGGVKALRGVTFDLRPGEVHALVGENGAGKSTLIKILSGSFPADSGEIRLENAAYAPAGPRDAKAKGLQVVHQEFNLLPHLSVAENISFEALPRNRFGFLDKTRMNARARQALDAIGLSDVDVKSPVKDLGIAHRQLVEIARALQSESRILILDEPTATLTDRETERLFDIVRSIQAKGVAVVFVSHHLNEVFEICDRVTVLRSGETIITEDIADTSPDRVVAHMVGRRLAAEMAQKVDHDHIGDSALRLDCLQVPQSPHSDGVSFDLHYGEILGIAGLVGAGRTEILRTIFGLQKPVSGQMLREGAVTEITGPDKAISAGIGFVTEDRKDEGLILDMSIAANSSLAALDQVSSNGFLLGGRERNLAEELGAGLNLKCGTVKDAASSLSGGNQQKVVLAKWLARQPKVLLLDEPTRGVDVGAKAEIYAILREQAAKGVALLVVSSELPELITLCDRILVLADHKIQGELHHTEFSEEKILRLAYRREEEGTEE
ncbi:sugar ABC transporter ATP-binding protein [Aestuariispira insulae]|uniref:Monosaccharide ABC transporter ATP-binding protein (CUT2 family) n=1 Tax=Aestuariispira insulae TaxID=1461337 RepID=A0A3D9HIG1_9PROT|nr:sugar ABC transporter ATP-binding protein [Aestuariispira insulae]RED49051.1 monosaccharide ABC transporter ATP-binding protein (CUT2 family) [Aestuariispira insulae]